MNNKKRLTGVITAVILSLSIFVIVSLFSDSSLIDSIMQIEWWQLLIGFGIFFTGYVVDAIRMNMVLRQFGHKISFIDSLYTQISGYLLTSITPFSAGGQAYQVYYLSTLGVKSEDSTNIIASRFVEHIFASLIISLFFYNRIVAALEGTAVGAVIINIGLGTSVGIGIIIILAVFKAQWLTILVKPFSGFKLFKKHRVMERLNDWTAGLRKSVNFLWGEKTHVMIMDVILGIFIPASVAACLYYYLVQYSGMTDLQYLDVFGAVVLLNMVVFYIPTPGASGSIEAVYILFFAGMVSPASAVTAAVFALRVASFYLQILFGSLVMLIHKKKHPDEIEPDDDDSKPITNSDDGVDESSKLVTADKSSVSEDTISLSSK